MAEHRRTEYISLCTWLLLCLVLLSSCSTPGRQVEQKPTASVLSCDGSRCVVSSMTGLRPLIDTNKNIHLFQSFDYRIENPGNVAGRYDFVWGAMPNKLEAFRRANPSLLLSYYFAFHRDGGPFYEHEIGIERDGTVTNAALAKRHDLNYWKATHPDWVLYKCDRKTPAYEYGDPNIPLDFSNPAIVPWQIKAYGLPASNAGYDALAADNLNMENLFGACGVYRNGQWVQLYSGKVNDPRWRADMLTWTIRMQAALHALPHPLALIPNLGLAPKTRADDPWVQDMIEHVDGVLDERGFTDYSKGYLTDKEWQQTIQLIKSVQDQGKPYYSVNQFPTVSLSHAQVQWVLASYLLAKERLAAVSLTSTVNGVQGYGDDRWRPEYAVPIGSPKSALYQAQGVYWRDYSGGLVVVNPSATIAYTVRTSTATYHDLYGTPVARTFTLPPHSGLLLIPG
jgi:hypothetical protein